MIRNASLEDLPALINIEKSAFDSSLYYRYANTSQHFRNILKSSQSEILAYLRKGILCGVAEILYRKNSQFARLYSLAVLPMYQGQGISKQLLKAVDNRVRLKGLAGVTCESRIEMVPFYESNGYKVLRILKGYYPNSVDGMKLLKKIGKQ